MIDSEEKIIRDLMERYRCHAPIPEFGEVVLAELFDDVKKIRVDTLISYAMKHKPMAEGVRQEFVELKKDFVFLWFRLDFMGGLRWSGIELAQKYMIEKCIVEKYTMVIPKEFDLQRMYEAIETLADIERVGVRDLIKCLVLLSKKDNRRDEERRGRKSCAVKKASAGVQKMEVQV